MSEKTCEWKRCGFDGCYYLTCEDFRVMMPRQRDVDDNLDRNFAFCPYCGGKLRIVDAAEQARAGSASTGSAGSASGSGYR